jgi:hypothetical protein
MVVARALPERHGRPLPTGTVNVMTSARSGDAPERPIPRDRRVPRPVDPAQAAAAQVQRAPSAHAAETAHAAQAGPSAGPRGMLALQRTAGNRAAGITVARQPGPSAPGVPLAEAEQDRIPPQDRHALETAVTGYIPLAFTAFSNATTAHVAAIKNEAKATAEMIAAVVDVATGFLAPVFANYVVGRLAAKAAAAPVEQVTKQAVTKLISQQDTLKASFTGATKLANQVMKNNANSLFGESEIDAFALGLRNAFQRGAGTLLNQVTTMSDSQLISLWAAYDPDNADESAYRGVLGGLFAHYQKQVEPIGDVLYPGPEGGPGMAVKLFDIQLASRTRLATVDVWDSGENTLWAWVTPDMASIARAKAAALKQPVQTLPLRNLQVPLAEILDPPRPDLRRKDMLEIVSAMAPGERLQAGANPDVITVVETGRETDGRVPNDYERHKTLFLLRGYSNQVLGCLDELDSWFPSAGKVDKMLAGLDSSERSRLAQDAWFVGKLRKEFGGYGLDQILFTLGLGPKPTPPAPLPPPTFPRGPKI